MISKKLAKMNSVLWITTPIYVLARMVGFWPFRLQFYQKPSKLINVHVNIFDGVWFACAIFMYASFAWFTIASVQDDIPFSLLERLISQMTQAASNSISILSIIMDMVNRKRIRDIIVRFNQFDVEIKAVKSINKHLN